MKTRIFFLLLAVLALSGSVFAEEGILREAGDFEVVPAVVAVDETCGFSVPNEKDYDADVVSVRRKLRVEPGEVFRVKVFLKNTGNMPWFSNKSSCLGPKMSLGTMRERDRDSIYYYHNNDGVGDANWEGKNRIGMDQFRVNPGEIASFTFWANAPKANDVRKEYFAPVLAGITWVDGAEFSFESMIGTQDEGPVVLRKKLSFANDSGSVMDINLNGEKQITVDLSDQHMKLSLDGRVIREFPVSTGARATPTPTGETQIILKQTVRVGYKPPHYVMPKYMMFRAGGYGFHALPSLGNDGGLFWTEARNHIGIPVSHGCIRLLPEDADFAYEFTDVGTKVVVEY
ncbi:MAG: L,D-transpeptidase [Candidatus Peregrinibacteria bacterium]